MAKSMQIMVVWSPAPRVVHEITLTLPVGEQGACVRDALAALAALQNECFAELPPGCSFGVWNQRVPANQQLNDGDRFEIYRPLRVDPKVARRERFKKQGAKSTGLFAQRRPGAKAGY